MSLLITMQYDSCLALFPTETNWDNVVGKLKPGAHTVAICPVLEHHRITQRVEDSGFEIRDCLMFLGNPELMVTLSRVPLDGTVAENVLKHGVGALNVDGCRIRASESDLYFNRPLFQGRYEKKGVASYGGLANWKNGDNSMPNLEGRWPTNVVVEYCEEIIRQFPESKGG